MLEPKTFASPEEALEHFGVKGMRWGVRKSKEQSARTPDMLDKPITRTLSNGDQITLSKTKPNLAIRLFSKLSEEGRENVKNSTYLEVNDKNGKKIGVASFRDKKDTNELYLSWITIKKSQRGNGYATEILRGAEEYGRANGKSKMSLIVDTEFAKDAKHIYEKMGFKKVDWDSDEPDLGEDGYIKMEYNF